MIKKWISAVSCTVILGLVLAGCGGKDGTAKETDGTAAITAVQTEQASVSPFNEPGTFPISKNKVKLTYAIVQSPNVQDYSTNKFTKFLSEKVNVEFEFVPFMGTVSDAKQKLAVMVNSNDTLPDVINLELKDEEVYQYGDRKSVV